MIVKIYFDPEEGTTPTDQMGAVVAEAALDYELGNDARDLVKEVLRGFIENPDNVTEAVEAALSEMEQCLDFDMVENDWAEELQSTASRD